MRKCAGCGAKLGIIRYNPPKNTAMSGQICGKCWNKNNESIKATPEYKEKIKKSASKARAVTAAIAIISAVMLAVMFLTR